MFHRVQSSRIGTAIGLALVASVVAVPARAQAANGAASGWAKVAKPKARSVTGAHCVNFHEGTLGGVFGRTELPLLAFTIGPKSAMADQMHASKAKFTGPGSYRNVIVMVYLGKTALDDTYGGLGTVTVNADWRTGSYTLNDGTSAGTWDCGAPVK
ncbi:MAG TPA: hypothetical protein VGG84_00880 [Gemmatimonadaceae bacterium]